MEPSVRLRVALICHEDDPIDAIGIASWAATVFDLVGIVSIRSDRMRRLRKSRRELRRVGAVGLLDVAAYRIFHRLRHGRADARWVAREVERLRSQYPADLDRVPKLVVESPNSQEAERFLKELAPEIVIARCKVILKAAIFEIPRAGTFVLHPGICPEYRNAHGCFWALAKRDLGRVGMTLLRIDKGVDTGPMYFQGSYAFDERRESHFVIQHRVVLENLPRIAATLSAVLRGEARPLPTAGRASATWGQPWLSAYLHWKWTAWRGRR